MQTRFRLFRRGSRGDIYYCVDTVTDKRANLGRVSLDEAQQIILAKNQAPTGTESQHRENAPPCRHGWLLQCLPSRIRPGHK